MKNDGLGATKDLSIQLSSFHSESRDLHTQNSAKRDRPQNKYLKPFKSRAELGGALDPRINKGGRPKLLREETAKWMEEMDETGKTNARKAVESVGVVAQSASRNSAAAFKTLHDMLGEDQEAGKGSINIGNLNPAILAAMQQAARSDL